MTDHFQWDGAAYVRSLDSYELYRWRAIQNLKWGLWSSGQSYRNPALLALMAATLQNLSGGRFIMGIGAGWKEDEYRSITAIPIPSRVCACSNWKRR